MGRFLRVLDTTFRFFLGAFVITLAICFALNWIGGVKFIEIADVLMTLYIMVCAVFVALLIIVAIFDRDDFKMSELVTTVPTLLFVLALVSFAIMSALRLYAYFGHMQFSDSAPVVAWYGTRYNEFSNWIASWTWLAPSRHALGDLGLTDPKAIKDIVIAVLGALIAGSISGSRRIFDREEPAPSAKAAAK